MTTTTEHREERDLLLRYARVDWVVTGRWNKLHQLAGFDDLDQAVTDWGGPGRFACGQRGNWVCIPGVFTRMGAPRCKRCCQVAGLPQGIGSPKNDAACRALLGLESA